MIKPNPNFSMDTPPFKAQKTQHRKTAMLCLFSCFVMIPYVIYTGQRNSRSCTKRSAQRHGERFPTTSELALTSCFRLLLTLYGRLLVVLALANLSDDAVFCAGTLETLECGIQGLVLTNAYFCHEFFPPFVTRQRISIKSYHNQGIGCSL